MNRLFTYALTLMLVAALTLLLHSCEQDGLMPVANTIEMLPNLSEYEIFAGDPATLTPVSDYHLYELSTELFTDYAQKQRLIKLPDGNTLEPNGSGLPNFPDGTILVKTFFYDHDKRDPAKGKRIIETRLLIKSGAHWSVGTYYWNNDQSDAVLVTTGMNETVNWIDDKGEPQVISYHIPSSRECSTCHHSAGKIIPIGPKLRNLNTSVVRNETIVNQLEHFSSLGLLRSSIDPALFIQLPDWSDESLTIEQRARAYLDVNCAHCHNGNGIAAETNLGFDFESSFDATRIGNHKRSIVSRLKNGTMPRLGTTVIHEEGVRLIRDYINGL